MIIGLGSVSSYLLYPFLCPIFNLVQDIIYHQLALSAHFNNHQLIGSAIFFLSQMFCIILEIISNYLQVRHSKKKGKTTLIVNNERIEEDNEHSQVMKEKQSNLILYVILCCVLEFCVYTGLNLFLTNPGVVQTIQLEMRALPIFVMAFLNIFFLKLPFYKHHLFSCVIIFIGFFSILLYHYIAVPINGDHLVSLYVTLLFALLKIIRAIKEMLDTYILQDKYVSPFKLLFYQGVSGIILSLIVAFFLQYKSCTSVQNVIKYCQTSADGNNNIYKVESFSNFFASIKTGKTIMLLLGFIITTIMIEVCRMQTKHYLTAIHRGLSCAASAVINWFLYLQFFDSSSGYEGGNKFELIGFIIILVGELIYCEVFICYFWGLEKNTKKMIEKRNTFEGELEKQSMQDLEKKNELTNKKVKIDEYVEF